MVQTPDQTEKRNYEKIFPRRLSLSGFLAKTLRVNKIAMKKLLKNLSFTIAIKLSVPPFMYEINAHNIGGMGS